MLGHAFFGLADGSMMAFMQFASAETHERMVGTELPGSVHIAVKVDKDQRQEVLKRIQAEGYSQGADY